MSKTLLAVDDSATIRKALEITFGGEGYRVLAADNRASALARLADKPDLILIDTVLGSEDGYALCQEVRAQMPGAAILLLSSRFNPYDTGRGQGAGADDYSDKPFDTQQLLDKARTVLEAKASAPVPAPVASADGPYRTQAEAPNQLRGPTATPANAIPAVQIREGSHPPSQPAARAQTLVFGSSPVNAQTANPYTTSSTPASAAAPAAPPRPAGPPPIPTRQGPPPVPTAEARPATPASASAPPPMPAQHAAPPRPAPTGAPAAAAPAPTAPPVPAAAAPTPAPAAATPAPAAVAPAAPAPVAPAPVAQTQQPGAPSVPPAASPVQTAVAAQLAPKLGALGLTAEQADAVLALSREVVERVVWEVVPQLAEVLIREEIQRLTKE